MRYLVTGEQIRQIDRDTIETIGIPSMVLMERAAMAVAREAERLAEKTKEVWALCGTGNNGADGIAAARILAGKGYGVRVILVGDPRRGTEEFCTQKRIAEKLGLPVAEWKDWAAAGCVREGCCCGLLIDGLFGAGLTRAVEGEYREALEMLGSQRGRKVVAVDLPSGIHSATGQVMGTAMRADVTVTFGYEKLGSVLYPGRDYCGRVVVEDIGLAPEAFHSVRPFARIHEREDLSSLPARPPYSYKGSFGKVLVVAGSKGMAGAAYLAALAACRMGAGLVKIMTDEANRAALQHLLPEAILTAYRPEELTEGIREAGAGEAEEGAAGPEWENRNSQEWESRIRPMRESRLSQEWENRHSPVRESRNSPEWESQNSPVQEGRNSPGWGSQNSPVQEGRNSPEWESRISPAWESRMRQECAWADVIVLGPGLGQDPHVRYLVRSVLQSAKGPVVLDADGLNAVAANPCLEEYYTRQTVITPHPGEMARLTGKPVGEIRADAVHTALDYSRRHGIVCVLKDAATVTAGSGGMCFVNTSGNSCMAKAGSGDVLAGAIAGLLAQGMEPFEGAAMGVFVHGLAGDRYRERRGKRGMLARELADELGMITEEQED